MINLFIHNMNMNEAAATYTIYTKIIILKDLHSLLDAFSFQYFNIIFLTIHFYDKNIYVIYKSYIIKREEGDTFNKNAHYTYKIKFY